MRDYSLRYKLKADNFELCKKHFPGKNQLSKIRVLKTWNHLKICVRVRSTFGKYRREGTMKELKHGKASTYTNHKCRCAECKAAIAEYAKRRRERFAEGVISGEHGKAGTYTNNGCRCEECKLAATERAGEQRAQRAEKVVPEKAHGTAGGYNNWGCRCEPCTVAVREYQREYLKRKAAK